MKVCLKRPDGSMVEQKHLTVTQKDGKYIINNTGDQNTQWLPQGSSIRAILIDNKQQIVPTNTQQRQQSGAQQTAQVQNTSHRMPQPQNTSNISRSSQQPQNTSNISRSSQQPQNNSNNKRLSQQPQNNSNISRFSQQPQNNSNNLCLSQQGTPSRRVVRAPQRKHHVPGTNKMALKQSDFAHQPAQPSQPEYKEPAQPEISTSTQYVPQQLRYEPPASPTTTYSPVFKQQELPNYKGSAKQSTSPSKQFYRPPQTTPTSTEWNNNSVLNGITSINNGSRKRYQEIPMDCTDCGMAHYASTPCALRQPSAGSTSVNNTEARKRPRRSSERGGKGLRHFSNKVCEKVKSKGVTTYLEVSEELVSEFSHNFNTNTPSCSSFDVKNIRRRVYDALNVLCAMNIISKDKKEIRWIGLPTNSLTECRQLEVQKQEMQQRIREKKKRAQEYMLQLIAYRTLVQRNKEIERKRGGPLPENSTIQVPFIILSTGPRTEIGLEVSNDKTKYEFTFNELFEIHDEIAILKKMGLCYGLDTGDFTAEGLAEAEELLPKSAKPYLKEFFPRKSDQGVEEDLEIVEDPQQIDIKYEPQEMSEVQKQALDTYSFDAPTYSSAYTSYNSTERSATAPTRETAAANTLLSLTTVNQ